MSKKVHTLEVIKIVYESDEYYKTINEILIYYIDNFVWKDQDIKVFIKTNK